MTLAQSANERAVEDGDSDHDEAGALVRKWPCTCACAHARGAIYFILFLAEVSGAVEMDGHGDNDVGDMGWIVVVSCSGGLW